MFPTIPLLPGFAVSSYFLIISFAVTISVLWFIRRAELQNLARVTAIDLSLAVLAGGFIGARLLHVLFEEPEYYRLHPLGILQVWNGGFVYLGGVIGAFIAAVIFCRIKTEPFWYWADVAVPSISLSYAIGRLACFMNGCCYGQITKIPWAIFMHSGPRHPTQLYASAWEFALLGILWSQKNKFKTSGVMFNTWLFTHCIGRIVMETFRADPRGHLILGLSLGMAMSLALMAWALFNIVASRLQS